MAPAASATSGGFAAGHPDSVPGRTWQNPEPSTARQTSDTSHAQSATLTDGHSLRIDDLLL
jgi:hypothetical protein